MIPANHDCEGDGCPWCEIDRLTAEVSRLQNCTMPPEHRLTAWRGNCGHEWFKSQSDVCPYCEIEALKDVPPGNLSGR